MTDSLRILVVDDEPGIRLFLTEALTRAGYEVQTAGSGEQALEHLRDARFDVAVLDLKLGTRVNGIRVLEAIRWRWPDTVVIMLTAHGSLESAMAAIQEGIDGYLLKPVEPGEVIQTVREALDRRSRLAPRPVEDERPLLVRGPFVLDSGKHTVTQNGQPLELAPSEFSLLAYLLEHAEQVISPAELVEAVRNFKPEYRYEAQQVIKWYIHRLRAKVEPDPKRPRYLVNVRGVGYMLQLDG